MAPTQTIQARLRTGFLAGWGVLVLAVGGAGTARAQDTPEHFITNVAHAHAHSPAGDSLRATSNEAVIGVGQRGARLEGTAAVTGACRVSDGRLRISGLVTLTNAGGAETEGLEVVARAQARTGAHPYADVEGARHRLNAGRPLAPGERASYPFALTFTPAAGAEYRVAATATVLNHPGSVGVPFGPELEAPVPGGAPAPCPGLVAEPLLADRLEVTKQAGVLEAALGEVIPYAVTVRNAGETTLDGVTIVDRLPAGVAFMVERVGGADSVRVEGREVRLWLGAPLAPGQERAVSYAVTLLDAGGRATLENHATAEAKGGAVRANTSIAVVRVRSGFALQSRAVVGRVWVDTNGDGRQGRGEPGAAGVDVWSADGEVVRTDRDGRFSFRNLASGAHVLRLNEHSLPAAYRLARAEDAVVSVRLDGWTTPQVAFRVLPSDAPAEAADAEVPPTPGGGLPVPSAASEPAAPTVAPLRSPEEREAEDRRALVEGPRVRILTPTDGAVVLSNRLYVGVQGEAGAPVRLFADDALLREDVLRPDGRMDFVGIELPEGPRRVRVWMQNSWGQAAWDSVAVHRSGAPASFGTPAEVPDLRADGPDVHAVRVELRDAWGVAVRGGLVTVEATGAAVEGADADPTSVGLQLAAGADGVIELPLRAGPHVGPGEVRLQAGDAAGRVPLRVLPSSAPLTVVGVAQAGLGAAPESFGAVTVRGAVGAETAVTVSYDSRRRAPGDDFFGRGYDPLDEGRYPVYGDDSERRVLTGGTHALSARVEQGYSWVAYGDVDTGDFGGGGRLATYRRAVSGVAARVETGPVAWRAYGSRTDQVLAQLQLRGDGTSGPYRVGQDVRPGTDRIAIEVRSAENAAVVIAREELVRFADYQIDYATGEVLLQRPLPASDPTGNPLFVVAMLERRAGGEARWAAGLRVDLEAGRLLGVRGADSLRVFALATHDAGDPLLGALTHEVAGAGVSLRLRTLTGEAEVLRAAADTTAFAARVALSWAPLGDRGRLEAEWTRIGAGFDPTVDPRLGAGLQDLRLGARLRVAEGAHIQLGHSRQRFDGYGAERRSTVLQVEQRVMGRAVTSELGASTDLLGAGTARSSTTYLTGKGRVAVTERAALWLEGGRAVRPEAGGPVASGRQDQVGVGASYRLLKSTHIEAVQRWVGVGAEGGYALLSGQLRTESAVGALWGGLDHALGAASSTSIAAGWRPRVRLTEGWSIEGMLERRFGLDRAPLLDPARALPFTQLERDRWAAGLGTQWVLSDSLGRLSARGEVHRGELARGHRFEVAGDAQVNRSLAFLTRHDWRSEDRDAGLGVESSREERSLAALAFRPTHGHVLNVLSKLEWRNSLHAGAGTRFGGASPGRRLIGMLDAIWSVRPGSELSARYAARRTFDSAPPDAAVMALSGPVPATPAPMGALGHYLGARVGQRVHGPVGIRLDGRLLAAAGQTRWNAAPSVVWDVAGQIEVEGGYRFGSLTDVDFAHGGNGPYLALSLRFTEHTPGRVADFWRDRVSR